jgi:hypothetical protein
MLGLHRPAAAPSSIPSTRTGTNRSIVRMERFEPAGVGTCDAVERGGGAD